jgi:hypothetical protein
MCFEVACPSLPLTREWGLHIVSLETLMYPLPRHRLHACLRIRCSGVLCVGYRNTSLDIDRKLNYLFRAGANESFVVWEGVSTSGRGRWGRGDIPRYGLMEAFQIGFDGIQVGPLDHPDCFLESPISPGPSTPSHPCSRYPLLITGLPISSLSQTGSHVPRRADQACTPSASRIPEVRVTLCKREDGRQDKL